MKPKVKPKKLPKLSTLKNKADKVFSLWVRRREMDEGGTVQCCTCSKLMHWKDSQAGHWISRHYLSTRWEPMNVAVQCGGCNGPAHGRHEEFAGFLLRLYGPDIVPRLLKQKHTPVKLSREWMLEVINKYSIETGD